MPETHSRLDWLTISVPGDGVYKSPLDIEPMVRETVYELTGETLDDETGKGRAFQQFRIPGDGVTAFYNLRGDVSVEIEGTGCARMHGTGHLWYVVENAVQSGKITRLDHATDILTSTTPTEFVGERSKNAHSAHSESYSHTGETCYVGSRRSDRYARVYRYAEPHPRADLLRIEHVFRRAYAAKAAADWLDDGDDLFASKAGNIYGWTHDTWNPQTTEKLKAPRPARGKVNTILWLTNSVAPAVAKLIANDEMTREEVIQAVLSRVPPSHG